MQTQLGGKVLVIVLIAVSTGMPQPRFTGSGGSDVDVKRRAVGSSSKAEEWRRVRYVRHVVGTGQEIRRYTALIGQDRIFRPGEDQRAGVR